jgi:Cytochrome c554 and c-prime
MSESAHGGRRHRRKLYFLFIFLAIAILSLPASSFYYEYSGGKACARCHEIWQPTTDWHASTHRNVACGACHGDVFTLDAGFHLNNMRRLITHVRGQAPEQVRLRQSDDFKVNERCKTCHQQEWAAWSASLHNATYKEIFLDAKHNRERKLTDDCLRCHGMHFDGDIRELITPVDTTGPWRILPAGLADRRVILCLSCHQMHSHGTPLARPAVEETSSAGERIHVSSVGLFDRREFSHVPMDQLPLPEMREGERRVKISPDQRQALCYQCHAPLASTEVASGDDRTPVGVHEGLSCYSCHETHGETTRASCAACHPRLSNCGIDVEKMDTTFKSTKSPHNIHFVKCTDCHTKGIPKRHIAERHAGTSSSAGK